MMSDEDWAKRSAWYSYSGGKWAVKNPTLRDEARGHFSAGWDAAVKSVMEQLEKWKLGDE